MKKFKLKGEQLYKKHSVEVIIQACRSGEPGTFNNGDPAIYHSKALQLRWVTLKEQLIGPHAIVNIKTGERIGTNNFNPTLLKHYQDESEKYAQTLST